MEVYSSVFYYSQQFPYLNTQKHKISLDLFFPQQPKLCFNSNLCAVSAAVLADYGPLCLTAKLNCNVSASLHVFIAKSKLKAEEQEKQRTEGVLVVL